MVEAAWIALEHHPHWKALFERLSRRLGKQKAVVAVAANSWWRSGMCSHISKLMYILMVRRSRVNSCDGWNATIRFQGTRLRQYLDQLGLTEQLEEVIYSDRVYRLAQGKGEPT